MRNKSIVKFKFKQTVHCSCSDLSCAVFCFCVLPLCTLGKGDSHPVMMIEVSYCSFLSKCWKLLTSPRLQSQTAWPPCPQLVGRRYLVWGCWVFSPLVLLRVLNRFLRSGFRVLSSRSFFSVVWVVPFLWWIL